MSYLPQYYFDDIAADEMKEIMNGMVLSERELEISRCESAITESIKGSGSARSLSRVRMRLVRRARLLRVLPAPVCIPKARWEAMQNLANE